MVELNIGHFLMGEALFVGLPEAIRTMREAMDEGRARSADRMIIGIGSDLCDIRRIERALERHGDAVRRTAASPRSSNDKSDRRAQRAASYAKRFAAKEACAKALGTGLRRGVFWRDMGVVNLPVGQPTMALTGGAARAARGDHAAGHEAVIHLTITDEFPTAMAHVIIEARPLA